MQYAGLHGQPDFTMDNLTKLDDSKNFYDSRYRSGYMDDLVYDNWWRVEDFLKTALPNFNGSILDFGTGNGRLAACLRNLYPNAQIYGVDISQVAIATAKKRYGHLGIKFLDYSELDQFLGFFDFVFSHHVLEHVYDLEESAALICSLIKPHGRMAHMLPSGNPGSLEHRIVQQTRNGMRLSKGNSFFYEDVGHLRRLTSAQVIELFRRYGFACECQWFSGQYWDTLNWVTQSPPTAWRLARIMRASSIRGAANLLMLKIALLWLCVLRAPASILRTFGPVPREHRSPVLNFLIPLARIFRLAGKPADSFLLHMSAREWSRKRTDPRGSGMFLLFSR